MHDFFEKAFLISHFFRLSIFFRLIPVFFSIFNSFKLTATPVISITLKNYRTPINQIFNKSDTLQTYLRPQSNQHKRATIDARATIIRANVHPPKPQTSRLDLKHCETHSGSTVAFLPHHRRPPRQFNSSSRPPPRNPGTSPKSRRAAPSACALGSTGTRT